MLKQYIFVGLHITLLHTTLLSYPINTTTQDTHLKKTQQLQDQQRLVENKKIKPTVLTSWRKVITLKWKTLTKADAWNIGKSVATIGAIGWLYNHYTKNILTNNAHHNPGQDNPGRNSNGPLAIPIDNDDNSNSEDSKKTVKTHQLIVPFMRTPRKNKACFFDYDTLPDDPQHIIALYMIADFLEEPEALTTNKDLLSLTTISPDNTRIVSAIYENRAKIWNVYNQVFHILEGHSRHISAIEISPNNAYVVTGSQDGSIKIWDMFTGQLLQSCIGHTTSITLITVHPDNKHMTTCSQGMIVNTWNMETGQLIETLIGYTYYSSAIRNYHISKVYTKHGDGIIELISKTNGQLLYSFTHPLCATYALATSRNDTYAIIGLSDKTVKIIPLTSDLEDQKNNALRWIKHTILPRQAHLITRAHMATQAKNVFIINSTQTDDVITWISFPMYVRDYLRLRLNIKLIK